MNAEAALLFETAHALTRTRTYQRLSDGVLAERIYESRYTPDAVVRLLEHAREMRSLVPSKPSPHPSRRPGMRDQRTNGPNGQYGPNGSHGPYESSQSPSQSQFRTAQSPSQSSSQSPFHAARAAPSCVARAAASPPRRPFLSPNPRLLQRRAAPKPPPPGRLDLSVVASPALRR